MNAENIKIVTFGCRINAYESEVMREKLADFKTEQMIYIINSCTVTGEAERQCRQTIRKLKKEKPQAVVIVTGCAAQINPEIFAEMPEVDYVLGNIEKLAINDLVNDLSAKVQVSDIFAEHNYKPYLINDFEGRTRAFVQVQQGCDHRCTYCIVPYARGKNFSIPEEVVIAQIKELIRSGFNEIVIAGIDVASYGMEQESQSKLSFLIKQILTAVPELKRLRISSMDPMGFDDLLIALIKDDPRLLPYFHLSIQSGDDTILKRMARRHQAQDVKKLTAQLFQARDDLVLGADFITGFPTETEAMFQNTVNLIKECRLTQLHVFPFSPRRGTPAFKMPQIAKAIAKQRAKILIELGEKLKMELFKTKLNHQCSVLIEKDALGFCEHYLPVKLNNNKKENTICNVQINKYDNNYLYGVCL